MMEIAKGDQGSTAPSERRTATFTGLVYVDRVLAAGDGVAVNRVFFGPGSRTYWHWHERGQLLQVIAGLGLICAEGGLPTSLEAGDVVWAAPGERHWHGGGPETLMMHLALSLGTTNWLEPVSDADYSARP
jgi:quercetin dioxygenase-like cupin family protein